MISILACLLPFMYIGYILPSSPLSTRVMHMIMMVTGVPPKHIQQGAEVVLGETPAGVVVIGVLPAYTAHAAPDKVMVIGTPPWHAQFMMSNPLTAKDATREPF